MSQKNFYVTAAAVTILDHNLKSCISQWTYVSFHSVLNSVPFDDSYITPIDYMGT